METKTVKTIYGQAWICGDSLVQDQIMVVPEVDSFSNTVVLIQNIWDDLTSASGQYKTNGNGYFYWEYTQTLIDNPDVEVTVNFECPKPKPGLFSEPYDPTNARGEWEKFWLTKYKTASDNPLSIQKRVIRFPEDEYYEWGKGEFKKIPESVVKNTDLGPIDTLLTIQFD